MKRSEINRIIADTMAFIDQHQFKLPPFAFWTPEAWRSHQADSQEIKDNMLGWDITDFGSGDFARRGLTLITLRNGNLQAKDRYPKPYAEKLLITGEEQETPMHFHWAKMEDIINRGGGVMVVELWNSSPDGSRFLDTPVTVSLDGTLRRVKAGEPIFIEPGGSITLEPNVYHRFYGKKGCGKVLLGEVSAVNDDRTDNRFYESLPRFPAIEEDEPPRVLLCSEY